MTNFKTNPEAREFLVIVAVLALLWAEWSWIGVGIYVVAQLLIQVVYLKIK